MTYQTEFPDFDPATMPEIPPGFVDEAWKNDICPCFHNAARGLRIWVDYADRERRELPDTERFTVTMCEDDEDVKELLTTDDWDAVEKLIDWWGTK